MIKFKAVLKRPETVGTWTYLNIPVSLLDVFGTRGRVAVCGTINGNKFRSSALPHGDGTHYIVVNREIRDALRVAPGDMVQVELEGDARPRLVRLPADLMRSLKKSPAAHAAFQQLSYSHKKEFVDWIEGAKKAETRQARVSQCAEMLQNGMTPKHRKRT